VLPHPDCGKTSRRALLSRIRITTRSLFAEGGVETRISTRAPDAYRNASVLRHRFGDVQP
jgi:hypothetical protein